jgi:probable rRNA maturation factor
MKLNLEINSQSKTGLSKKYFENIILETIELSRKKISKGLNISLAIVSEQEIRKINKTYRNKDKATDILSFSDYSSGEKSKSENKNIFFELILCYSYIEKYARAEKIPLKKEMAYVISHGVLHCLGFKHSRKMYEIQDKIADKF